MLSRLVTASIYPWHYPPPTLHQPHPLPSPTMLCYLYYTRGQRYECSTYQISIHQCYCSAAGSHNHDFQHSYQEMDQYRQTVSSRIAVIQRLLCRSMLTYPSLSSLWDQYHRVYLPYPTPSRNCPLPSLPFVDDRSFPPPLSHNCPRPFFPCY